MRKWLSALAVLSTAAGTAFGVESLNITQVGRIQNWSGEAVVTSGNFAYVAAGDDGLRILDVGDPSMMFEAGYLRLPGVAASIAILGSFAFLATGWGGVTMVDVSNPANPWEVSYFDGIQGLAVDVAAEGRNIYAAYSPGGLVVLEISDQDDLIPIAFLERESSITAVAAEGNLLVATGPAIGTAYYNIENPREPTEAARLQDPYLDLALHSGRLLAANAGGLVQYDVTDPRRPVREGSLQMAGGTTDISISADCEKALMAGAQGWVLAQIQRRQDPTRLYSCYGVMKKGAALIDGHALILDGTGVTAFDTRNWQNPAEVGFAANLGADVMGVEKAGDYAVSIGRSMAVIDITYPNRPVALSLTPLPGSADPLKLVGPLVYIPCEDLRVYDISDPRHPEMLGNFQTGNGMGNRDVDVEGDRAALINQDNLYLVDVNNPRNMQLLGHYQTANNIFFSSIDMVGHLVYAAASAGVMVFDASDPRHLDRVAVLDETGGGCFDVLVEGSLAYVSGGPYYNNDPALHVIDVSDPLNSVQLGYAPLPAAPRSITKSGDWVYVADGWAGVQVVDVSDPERPIRVGYYTEESDNCVGVTAFDRFVMTADRYKGIGVFQNTIQPNSAPVERPVAPTELLLSAYPNPFNAQATIQTVIPTPGLWSLTIYGADGTEVACLTDGWRPAGAFRAELNAARLPAGSYFARLTGNGMTNVQRVVLMR